MSALGGKSPDAIRYDLGHDNRRQPMTTVVQIRVKPQSRVSALTQGDDGQWLAQIKSLPVDGKANEELISLVAKQFGCAKSKVSIKSGAASRVKLVRIDD